MLMSTKTKCPHCSKILTLKSEAAVGRKVPCPQCREPFTVKLLRTRPKPPVEEQVEEYDEYGGSYDEYDDQAYDDYGDDDYGDSAADDGQHEDDKSAPQRASSAKSSKKTSKKKKKTAGLPPWLTYAAFGLAGVLVLGGLAGATVMIFGSTEDSGAITGNENSEPAPDAESPAPEAHVADTAALSSPADTAALSSPADSDMAQSTNRNPEDFETAVNEEKQDTLGELDAIRGRIKSTTGNIQDAVPGGK
jgi:DNA-directed RNA polymerase subunit RPC12/RpoP